MSELAAWSSVAPWVLAPMTWDAPCAKPVVAACSREEVPTLAAPSGEVVSLPPASTWWSLHAPVHTFSSGAAAASLRRSPPSCSASGAPWLRASKLSAVAALRSLKPVAGSVVPAATPAPALAYWRPVAMPWFMYARHPAVRWRRWPPASSSWTCAPWLRALKLSAVSALRSLKPVAGSVVPAATPAPALAYWRPVAMPWFMYACQPAKWGAEAAPDEEGEAGAAAEAGAALEAAGEPSAAVSESTTEMMPAVKASVEETIGVATAEVTSVPMVEVGEAAVEVEAVDGEAVTAAGSPWWLSALKASAV
mmetsp:Transcript_14624/g.43157  ORF Transcript_14624/g.43157 Transcript_14624/m.43157 type:complete len:308 (-) Transcript_14624:216-1139(-)